MKKISLIAYASGEGGRYQESAQGPLVIKNSTYLTQLKQQGIEIDWKDIIQPNSQLSKFDNIFSSCKKLADLTRLMVSQNECFIVLGGDHSSAIGTWSGASHALQQSGSIGLIWIDAHMDSHTPETTPSGNIHGMPLACLLGEGNHQLTGLLNSSHKIKPENLCLIGIRSFESAEENLLKKLKVRIFYMDEVKDRGLAAVTKEAIDIVTRHTVGFGISLDIDAIDPTEAPGTGVAEPDGLKSNEVEAFLSSLTKYPKFLGAEIVEFDPHRDKEHMTEKLIFNFITTLARSHA